MIKLVLPLFLVASSIGAQAIKGHYIGETATEFKAAEPALASKLDGCLTEAPRELSLDEIKQRFGKKGLADFQKRAAAAPSGTHIAIYDKNVEDYKDRCEALVLALRDGNGKVDGTGYSVANTHSRYHRSMSSDVNGIMASVNAQVELDKWRGSDTAQRQFAFSGGKLVYFSTLLFAPYSNIVSDMDARLKAKGVENLTPMHNAYGATWNDASTQWITSTMHASVFEDRNPASREADVLVIESRDMFESKVQAESKRTSSLD